MQMAAATVLTPGQHATIAAWMMQRKFRTVAGICDDLVRAQHETHRCVCATPYYDDRTGEAIRLTDQKCLFHHQDDATKAKSHDKLVDHILIHLLPVNRFHLQAFLRLRPVHFSSLVERVFKLHDRGIVTFQSAGHTRQAAQFRMSGTLDGYAPSWTMIYDLSYTNRQLFMRSSRVSRSFVTEGYEQHACDVRVMLLIPFLKVFGDGPLGNVESAKMWDWITPDAEHIDLCRDLTPPDFSHASLARIRSWMICNTQGATLVLAAFLKARARQIAYRKNIESALRFCFSA